MHHLNMYIFNVILTDILAAANIGNDRFAPGFRYFSVNPQMTRMCAFCRELGARYCSHNGFPSDGTQKDPAEKVFEPFSTVEGEELKLFTSKGLLVLDRFSGELIVTQKTQNMLALIEAESEPNPTVRHGETQMDPNHIPNPTPDHYEFIVRYVVRNGDEYTLRVEHFIDPDCGCGWGEFCHC